MRRRPLLQLAAGAMAAATWPRLSMAGQAGAAGQPGGEPARDLSEGDPFGSLAWPGMKREFLPAGAQVVFDPRVGVAVPAFAEDPMNVPVSVRVQGLADVELITVLVDRNPIRKVLDFQPVAALPALSFRFKLEQGSPVRALARTRDGVWHVGGAWVDSTGGGCTVPGTTRKDGSWSSTLGQASGRLLQTRSSALQAVGAPTRLRLRVMHPMDTGLVGGIPAFFVNKLSVRDGQGRELAQLATFEPVSDNPVFSFDFASPPAGGVHVVGTDNNGNRIASRFQ